MRFLASNISESFFGNYTITLYGYAEDGKPLIVKITDAKPWAAVFAAAEHDNLLIELNGKANTPKSNLEIVETRGRFFSGFPEEEPVLLIRSTELNELSDIIRDLTSRKFRLAHQNVRDYANVLAREIGFPLFDWLEVPMKMSSKQTTVRTAVVTLADLQPAPACEDQTVQLFWDTETYNGPSGSPAVLQTPSNKHVNYSIEIISIGAVFCRVGREPEPSDMFVFTNHAVEQVAGHTNVPCEDERSMLRSYFDEVRRRRPAQVFGFNDGGFDWPLLVRRAAVLNLIGELQSAFFWESREDNKHKQFWRCMRMPDLLPENPKTTNTQKPAGTIMFKLDASTSVALALPKPDGALCVDAMPLLRKANLKGRYDLNSFLAADGFEAKLGMSFVELWKHYLVSKDPTASVPERAEALRFLTYNTEYCVYDAKAVMLLVRGRKLLDIRRQFANYARVSLYDAVFRADAMKVENLVFAYAERLGYYCSTVVPRGLPKPPKQKGAFCACFERGRPGLQRPVEEVDFSSLYPNIIITLNLSHETLTTDRARLPEGPHYELEFEDKEGNRHRCWTLDDAMDPAKKGVLPRVLLWLYEERKRIRAEVEPHAEVLEDKEGEYQAAHPMPEGKLERVRYANAMRAALAADPDYRKARLAAEMLDGKQLAVKILLNTIYGATGAATSPIHNNLITGAVTYYGRESIQDTRAFGDSLGFRTLYIDTDSNYVRAPEDTFAKMDAEYAAGRLSKREWQRAMVEATHRRVVHEYYPKLCEHIVQKNRGKPYLRMELGKIMYPYLFTRKKMYHGVAHHPHGESVRFTTNFSDSASWVIKGISMARQDTTPFMKQVGFELFRDIYETAGFFEDSPSVGQGNEAGSDVDNSVAAIVMRKLDEMYNDPDRYPIHLFEKYYQWRPGKHNATVLAFVERMKARYEASKALGAEISSACPPDPNSKFAAVVTEPQRSLNIKGCLNRMSVGDKLEYPAEARRLGLQVDRHHYFSKFHSLCEQQLTYLHPELDGKELASRVHGQVIEYVKRFRPKPAMELKRRFKAIPSVLQAASRQPTLCDLALTSAQWLDDPETLCRRLAGRYYSRAVRRPIVVLGEFRGLCAKRTDEQMYALRAELRHRVNAFLNALMEYVEGGQYSNKAVAKSMADLHIALVRTTALSML